MRNVYDSDGTILRRRLCLKDIYRSLEEKDEGTRP